MSSNKRKKKKKFKRKKEQPVFVPPLAPLPKSNLYRSFVKGWKIFKAILLILGGIGSLILIYEVWFKSDYEKFKDEKIKQGTVEFDTIQTHDTPENISNVELRKQFIYNQQTYHYPAVKGIYVKNLDKMRPKDNVDFVIGSNTFVVTKEQLDSGINLIALYNSGISICKNDAIVWAIAQKNRVYISAKFIDLGTDPPHEIGEMKFNHWTIYKDEFMDYTPGKDRFEVKDKQGYIVFSIADISSNGEVRIAVNGYFNSPYSVLFFSNQNSPLCIQKSDSNWLKKAETFAAKIKSVFPLENK
jgi:hypothetical protein